jgi:hypothetical protein
MRSPYNQEAAGDHNPFHFFFPAASNFSSPALVNLWILPFADSTGGRRQT